MNSQQGTVVSQIASPEKIYTKHLPGYSIIEQTVKDGKTDNPLIFLEE